jgi:hypothetical protein
MKGMVSICNPPGEADVTHVKAQTYGYNIFDMVGVGSVYVLKSAAHQVLKEY